MPMQRLMLSLPTDLLERIDAVRGDVPRAAWLRTAARIRLDEVPPIRSATSVQPMPDPYAKAKQLKARREVDPRFKKG